MLEMGGQRPPQGPVPLDFRGKLAAATGANTTIGVVATDAPLTKAQARRMAVMAQDGLAVAIRPIHTPFDGDTIFALATGRRSLAVTRRVCPGATSDGCTSVSSVPKWNWMFPLRTTRIARDSTTVPFDTIVTPNRSSRPGSPLSSTSTL